MQKSGIGLNLYSNVRTGNYGKTFGSLVWVVSWLVFHEQNTETYFIIYLKVSKQNNNVHTGFSSGYWMTPFAFPYLVIYFLFSWYLLHGSCYRNLDKA